MAVMVVGLVVYGCSSADQDLTETREPSVAAVEAITIPLQPADRRLIDAALSAQEPELRRVVVAAIGRLEATGYRQQLRAASADPSREVRLLARRVWFDRAPDEAVRGLLSEVLAETEPARRDELAASLVAFGQPACVQLGRHLLAADDSELAALLDSFMPVADAQILPALIQAWLESAADDDRRALLRGALFDGLSRFGGEAGEPLHDLIFRSRRSDPRLHSLIVAWLEHDPRGPAVDVIEERIASWALTPPLVEQATWRAALAGLEGTVGRELRAALDQRLAELEHFPAPLVTDAVEKYTAPGLSPWRGERDVVVRLHDGIIDGADLILEFSCRDGVWPTRAWGHSPSYNKGSHRVEQVDARVGPRGELLLDLSVQVMGDRYFRGGPAAYQLVLGLGDDGFEGTYTGSFRGGRRAGKVSGSSYAAGQRRYQHLPLAPGEHPRFGLRLRDWRVPRHVMETTAGRDAMRYVLDPPKLGHPVDIADSTVIAARRYDDYYYQVDPELRRHAADALLSQAKNLHLGCQYAPWHNYKRWYGGVGAAALAILGDPVSEPPRPVLTPWRELTAPDDLILGERGDEVPVIVASDALRADAVTALRHWLHLGNSQTRRGDWPEDLVMRPGQSWRLDEQEHTVRVLPPLTEALVAREDLVPSLAEAGYLYAVLEVTFEHAVSVQLGGRTRMWIGGQAVDNHEVIRLGVGRYPVVLEIVPNARWLPGRQPTVRLPALREVEDPQVRMAKWRRRYDHWRATGSSLLAEELVELADLHIRWYCRWAIGDGGFITETEGYTNHTFNVFSDFLHGYVHTHGVNLVADSHAEWLPLRHRAASFRSGGGPGFWDGGVISRLFPPWVQEALAAKTPADFPGHGIIDHQKASVIFRNGWRSDEADIFLVGQGKGQHLRAAHTHYQTGSFRLYGLGQAWTDTVDDSRSNKREDNSVLLLPDDPINGLLPARIEHVHIGPDGSGALTLDMDAVYLAAVAGRSMVDHEGTMRSEGVRDLGIRGRRAFAVDFSGAAGVPGLVVIADEIEGGGRRVWQMHLPEGVVAGSDGRTFTLRSGGACLQGTVVAPAEVHLRISDDRRLLAESPGGDFLVVMTMQRGEAPPVESAGHELTDLVRVGRQTIRYHQQRLIFEPVD